MGCGSMWKRSLVALALVASLAALPLVAQRGGFPPGPMQEKAQGYCLACHDARITVQQRLDRAGWTRVMDKMIRWGTPIELPDREPLIDYFAEHFGPAADAVAPAKLAEGEGADAVKASCLGCHDAGRIAATPRDRRAWARLVAQMERFGAPVADRRDAILDYLGRHYSPAPRE